MQPSFPFSALVGQPALRRALLLAVIRPALGGVLVRGTKGVAKSTAVRALAALLPPIETVAGCPFQRAPGEDVPGWPLPDGAPVVTRPVPLVELPLGATEDRVLGSLHLERALRGERAFEPGLLAAANRGILYIDEVNLLPDHLVDILLDAAASGVHHVEREGLSLRHPARFALVGTMNPEEGDLRPQLLDRFGLVVDVADLSDPADRAEAVRRRLAHEADPAAFAAAWAEADRAEAGRIEAARRRLPQVRVGDDILSAVSTRCLAAGVEGLRADLTLCRAAAAWAAYQGRAEVEPADVDAVAELALAHRRTRPPQPPDGPGNGSQAPRENGSARTPQRPGPVSQDTERPQASAPAEAAPEQRFTSAGLFVPRVRPDAEALAQSNLPGRWRDGSSREGRAASGLVRAYRSGWILSWSATVRAAAPQQAERWAAGDGGRLLLCGADLRGRPRHGPAGCLLLFVVDASGSMAAWQRMRQTKAAVLALLRQAYQRRDRVALLALRGRGAELVLPPARGFDAARRALEDLPVGGATPLAHGLAAACRLVRGQQRRQPRQPVWTVLLTDGRTNVSLSAADPWQDVLAQARALAACGSECLVVDTETGWPRFGRARRLAAALAASCLSLEEVLGRPLPDHWRPAV
jgi:magnesium chelatase subunit D